ncbi:MAG: DUF429 domain-containing protein [Haloferacaceae archaeon]
MDDSVFVGAHRGDDRWVAVAFDRAGFVDAAVLDGVGDVWGTHGERAVRILVDVPVGLVEEGDAERRCDVLTRAALGPRADAVVAPPVREATRKRRYPVADRAQERRTGHGLSRRAFARSDAVAALDDLLGEVPEARERIVESNPELCFRALAGDPLSHPRRIAGGYAERMRVLAEFDPEAAPTVQSAAEATDGADVTVADVLDAVVLGYAARPGPGSLRSLPADPPTDPTGLPMRTCYRSESPVDPEAP